MNSEVTELHHDCHDTDRLHQNEIESSELDSIGPASDFYRFPFHFFKIDPNERLPRPPAPESELLAQAEQLVSWAVSSKHENSPARHVNNLANDHEVQSSKKPNDLDDNESPKIPANAAIEAAKCHSLLADLLARKSNPALLHAALHAILTSNHGRELDRLVSHSKLHAQTIHLIMRLDPFVPGVEMGGRLRELEGLRRDRKNAQDCSNREGQTAAGAGRRGVQIAESSILYKEDQKYVAPVLPFFRYHIADVHLYLIVALVSNNSLLSVSAVRAIWKLLTDFGSKCENALREVDEERRRNIVVGRTDVSHHGAADNHVECSAAPAKRMKCDAVTDDLLLQQPRQEADTVMKSVDKEELQSSSEGLQLVPGMNGLSVDFVKESFYSDNASDFHESICSEHLTRGRVYRLLLALVNIFRLNHRSKNELLREVSNNFPHYKTSSSAFYRWYINMCLQLVYIVPTLEGPIMNLLVDQALEMDVQIKINDKGGVVLDPGNEHNSIDDNADSKKRPFQLISQDNFPDRVNTGTLIEAKNDLSCEDIDPISEIAERLDYLMNIICHHIEQLTSFSPDSLSEALDAVVNARRFYRHLLAVFDNKVRTTDRSKFVPFLYFVLFGREHDSLEAAGKLMAKRSNSHQKNAEQTIMASSMDMMENESSVVIDHGVISAPFNQTDFLYRGFCAKLIDLFYNPIDAGVLPSQTVVCCLASFVSRATYVCPETVCECVAAILQWVEVYIAAHSEPEPGAASVPIRQKTSPGLGVTNRPREIHALFYTACQAAFYIMCFRGAEALHYYQQAWLHRDENNSPYAQPESVNVGPKRWKLICNHPLQPLKYCLESVRVEFLHVAEDLDLFLEDSLEVQSESQELETKQFIEHLWRVNDEGNSHLRVDKIKKATPSRKRSSIISTAATQEKKRLDGGVGGLGKGSNPLDSYFPFDPYLLKVSYRFIHPYYRNWEDCCVNTEDNDKVTVPEVEGVAAVEIHSSYNERSDFQDVDDDDNTALTHSEEENDGDESNHDETENNNRTYGFISQCGGSGFEMEIRRSRAMSTGSQCSW